MTLPLKNHKAAASLNDDKWSPILGGYSASFCQNKKRSYWAGNSLGLQPEGFTEKNDRHAKIWLEKEHDGHFEEDGTSTDRPWWKYQEKLVRTGSKLLGARYDVKCPEVAFFNTLSTNNRNLIETFAMYVRDDPKNAKIIPTIVTIKTNFPSDDVGLKYALKVVFGSGKFKLLEIMPDKNGIYDFQKMVAIIETQPNVIMGFFPGLCYVTGQRFPIKEITTALHKVGAIAGFDLAHSVGNYQLNLHDDGADFATFPGYKYLNGGPGAVGGIFVHSRWFRKKSFDYVSGWFGVYEKDRFKFDPKNYRPAPGAWGFIQSNDQIFNMLGVEANFDLIDKYGKNNLFQKNKEISTYLYECLKCIPGICIITPEPFAQRGCQVLFKVKGMDMNEVHRKLLPRDFCEMRGKDAIRVAPVAYNSFAQVWKFSNHLQKIVLQ